MTNTFRTSGVSELAYIPPKPIMARDDWPTLGQMIETNKRLVVFVDHGAERAVNPTANFILPEFQMACSFMAPCFNNTN